MQLLTSCPGACKWFEFLKREDGALTVETLLWLPAYFGAFMLMTDVAVSNDGQMLLYGTERDAGHVASNDIPPTPAGAESEIRTGVQALAPQTTPDATMSDSSAVTTVSMPANDLVTAVWFGALAGSDVTVSGAHFIEF